MAKHILSRKDSEKRVRPPGVKANNGYTLPTEKLEQREAAFVVYRDMGPGRSLTALERELKQHHTTIAATRPSLLKWSVAHQWQERVNQHDIAARTARVPSGPQLDGEFDQVAKLTSAAQLAITRALSGTPVVTKASDVKTLIDAGANALKMAEAIRARQGDGASREVITAEITRILDLAEQRRRTDAVDALRAFGVSEEQMVMLGLRREDGVRVDMSMQAPVMPQVVVSGEDEVAIDPEPEDEVTPEEVSMVKDVAVVAPQPGPIPTRFEDLLKGLSGTGMDE
jgi:hypothetical protein